MISGPVAGETELIAVLEPGCRLFDTGLFDVFGHIIETNPISSEAIAESASKMV